MAAAGLWTRLSSVLRRSFFTATIRCSSDAPCKPENIHKGKYASDTCELPDSLGHSVGVERQELLKIEAGDNDPFAMALVKRGKGTFEEPVIITSSNKKRMIGCICEEDSMALNWMYVHKGEPKRCECGYWIKLIDAKECDHH